MLGVQILLADFKKCIFLLFFTGAIQAAPFQAYDANARQMGVAFAGTSAHNQDASINFGNPAGLVFLEKDSLVISGVGHYRTVEIQPNNAIDNSGNPLTHDLAKSNKASIGPAFHFAKKLREDFSVGLSLTEPFFVHTNFKPNSSVRYLSTKAKLLSYDINPNIAYQINSQTSIGLGIDVAHTELELNRQVRIENADQSLNQHLKGWGYGWHLGFGFHLSEQTYLGASFRSQLKHSSFKKDNLSSKITLPEIATISIKHTYADVWRVLADVQWAHWSRLESIRLSYNDMGQSTEYHLGLRNAWRLALGGEYFCQKWSVKAGFAWDQTPVKTKDLSAHFSATDRYWLTAGVDYQLLESLTLSLSYAHIFADKANLTQRAPQVDLPNYGRQQVLEGKFKDSEDIVGVQLTWNFV